MRLLLFTLASFLLLAENAAAQNKIVETAIGIVGGIWKGPCNMLFKDLLEDIPINFCDLREFYDTIQNGVNENGACNDFQNAINITLDLTISEECEQILKVGCFNDESLLGQVVRLVGCVLGDLGGLVERVTNLIRNLGQIASENSASLGLLLLTLQTLLENVAQLLCDPNFLTNIAIVLPITVASVLFGLGFGLMSGGGLGALLGPVVILLAFILLPIVVLVSSLLLGLSPLTTSLISGLGPLLLNILNLVANTGMKTCPDAGTNPLDLIKNIFGNLPFFG